MDDKYLAGLYDNCTSEDRRMVVKYLEHLKSLNNGWKICVLDFNQKIHCDDPARFFCLQVIEHHIRMRHMVSSEDDTLLLKELLLSWSHLSNDTKLEKLFMKKKMAQLCALTFVIDYPVKWPLFFTEFFSSIKQETALLWAVEYYLRVLLAIDEEIVDRDAIHTPEENFRNTVIKDHIRDTCAESLTDSWFQIMTSFDTIDHDITCLTMSVIGAYVSWMDVTLIVNEKCISLLLKYLSVPTLRESAAECFHDILSKGMEPMSKMQLTESLFVALEESQVLSIAQKEENFDFLMKLSKLINRVGIGLINCYNQFIRVDDHERALICLGRVEAKFHYLLRFLCDEDDGVSENIMTFSTQYITTLKHLDGNLSDSTRQNVQSLLHGVVKKLAYDEAFNFSKQGEEEALFLEYRGRLKVLFDNISLLDPNLTMELVQAHILSVLCNLNSESFMNIEVALLLITYLGDNYFEKLFGSAGNPRSPLFHIMNLIFDSDLSFHNHPAVVLQYFDVITKHDKFFSSSTKHIPLILTCFIDQRGIHNVNASVRSRVCYKFLQFIKSLKSHIGEYSIEILNSLENILLSTPAATTKNQNLITDNDLLFLFEAAGYLIVYSFSTSEDKQKLMMSLLAPLMEKFNFYLPQVCQMLRELMVLDKRTDLGNQSTYKISPLLLHQNLKLLKMFCAETESQQECIAQTLYMLLSYASRSSKVFSNHQLARQSGCLQPFEEVLPTIFKGLDVTIQRELLHSGVRQYLHRMIISLGDELLKYIPLAVTLLLKECKSHDIQEFIPLINQLITKYKVKIIPVVNEIFIPVTTTIVSCLAEPFDPIDTEELRDRTALQKAYYLFVNSITVNDIVGVIISQGSNQVDDVLKSLIDGTKHSDISIQRISFQTLKKLIEFCSTNDHLPGFIEFSYKEVVPVCFVIPIQSFDMDDAQAFLAIGEIAGVLKALFNWRREEFVFFLRDHFLPSINILKSIVEELLCKLEELNAKILKIYLKELFVALRRQ